MKIKNLLIVVSIMLASACISVADTSPRRIVSLIPSGTEILFALGIGDEVVGVTKYCRYPPQAQDRPKVGGVLDTSFEAVARLEPDLCVIDITSESQIEILRKIGCDVAAIETRSIDDILKSITKLGQVLGRERQAAEVTQELKNKIIAVKAKVAGRPQPTVLITFLRPMGDGQIREVYIAGNHTFFNDLITIAGGVNAYQGSKVISSPVVTAEGILQMDPDIIIEAATELAESGIKPEAILKDWDMLSELKAYQNKQIHVLTQPYIGIPGPRVSQALEDIARLVHPELDWGTP